MTASGIAVIGIGAKHKRVLAAYRRHWRRSASRECSGHAAAGGRPGFRRTRNDLRPCGCRAPERDTPACPRTAGAGYRLSLVLPWRLMLA